MTTTCPPGLTLQANGICGTGTPTILQTAATYCGPQYATKNCVYTAQLTSALTPATGNESIPNTICAFMEAGIQTPCDPGCCVGQPTTQKTVTTGASSSPFPLWAILLLIGIGIIIVSIVIYLATRKKKLNGNSNGAAPNRRLPNGDRLGNGTNTGN